MEFLIKMTVGVSIKNNRFVRVNYGSTYTARADGYGFSIYLEDGRRMMVKEREFKRI